MQPLADMGEAFRSAKQDPVILALIGSKFTFAVGSGIVAVLAVMAKRTFHAGDDGVGPRSARESRCRARSAHRGPARRAQGQSPPAALRDGRCAVGRATSP
ncbi:MAG: hypothetical protein R2715_19480 [Ilumatobacteraceae bacterium]